MADEGAAGTQPNLGHPQDHGRVEVVIDDPRWAAIDPIVLAQRCAWAVEAVTNDPALRRVTTALFTNDDEVHELNAAWRGHDKPTNVLSFPAEPLPGLPEEAQPLGDLALAFETCAREADAQGVGLAGHAAHLVVHGLLHLLGYDHIDKGEADLMEALERKALGRLGLADPYRDEHPAT